MATNPIFQNGFSDSFKEQSLLDSLSREVIQMIGQNVYYIKREMIKIDEVLNEVNIDEFNKATLIEMSFETDGFKGDQAQFSKFGFENKDELNFFVSRSRFFQETQMKRPREGDLIFFPLTEHLFEIKFVEEDQPFRPLGEMFIYQLNCQLFRYNYQKFKTDIPSVDLLSTWFKTKADPFANNEVIQEESRKIIDFNEKNPFGEF